MIQRHHISAGSMKTWSTPGGTVDLELIVLLSNLCTGGGSRSSTACTESRLSRSCPKRTQASTASLRNVSCTTKAHASGDHVLRRKHGQREHPLGGADLLHLTGWTVPETCLHQTEQHPSPVTGDRTYWDSVNWAPLSPTSRGVTCKMTAPATIQ